MGLFHRGGRIWISFKDQSGQWKSRSSGFAVGEEVKAQELLDAIKREVAQSAPDAPKPLTVAGFAKGWLETRATETIDDDRGRLENHILPALGEIPLVDLGPKAVRSFVKSLDEKRTLGQKRKDGTLVGAGEPLAPRTVRNIYGTLRAMLSDARADELIKENPCQLKRGELPRKRDKDPTWRRTAVFTRDEVETIISATGDLIPEDRRMLYALMFLGAMRFGEAAALTWADYDRSSTPLGRLVIEKSYSTRQRKVKGTKTENPREMPVHGTLAGMLAEWHLSGFERMTGRQPEAGDLIVPSREGNNRNVNHGLRRFHQDLARVGLRPRRQHDARRTFISIARSDGALKDPLHAATHGTRGDIDDQYTEWTWQSLCAEVVKARISRRTGKVIELPLAKAAGAELTPLSAASVQRSKNATFLGKRSGADGTRTRGLRRDRPAL